MPRKILTFIKKAHPRFEKCHSVTAGTDYFMNVCDCGEKFGDHFLFSEPGGAFFPMNDADLARITVQRLPFAGVFEFHACDGHLSEEILSRCAVHRQQRSKVISHSFKLLRLGFRGRECSTRFVAAEGLDHSPALSAVFGSEVSRPT